MAAQAEPTLADVIKSVWAARFFVLAGAVAGLLSAFIFLAVAVPHYRITMLAAPAERAARTDIKALLPDNPSFALQYLVNSVGSQDSTDFIRFENMLRGPSVAASSLKDEKITAGVRRSGKYIFSSAPDMQTSEALAAFLEKNVSVLPVGNTPLRRIVVDHPVPDFGLYLLRRLYEETDRLIRREVAGKAQKRSVYLKDLLEKITHPDHRRALTSLLMEQEHILMVLAMDEPFAAIIAEPPSVSVRQYWPRKGLVFSGFIFAGMVLGFAFRSARREG